MAENFVGFWGTGEVLIHQTPGYARLVDFMGGDLAVVNSARISFQKQHSEMKPGDGELIDFLLRNRHGTPFESTVFTFQVACPIFVAREWFRHRIGSFNEVSGRYTKLKPVFYVPRTMRQQVGKPGNYKFKEAPTSTSQAARLDLERVYLAAWATYRSLLGAGVAKELARLALPVAIFTEFRWTVNARSLMNFLSLRTAPNAMQEIRQLAEEVGDRFSEVMPCTSDAFFRYGSTAP